VVLVGDDTVDGHPGAKVYGKARHRRPEGTHRDEYSYANDPTLALDPASIVTRYAGRWNIESTFQEAHAHVGLESTRGRCRATAERAVPVQPGLGRRGFIPLPARGEAPRGDPLAGEGGVSFSDAVSAVRLWLWTEWVFPRAGGGLDSTSQGEESCGRPSRRRYGPHASAPVEVTGSLETGITGKRLPSATSMLEFSTALRTL
jgi:hypothetical protein